MIDITEVSAFSARADGGNPAAVVVLPHWPDDTQLERLARATEMPVTSFLVRNGGEWQLRWYSRAGRPVQSMCGHGTLAASRYVHDADKSTREVVFHTPGGAVPVRFEGEHITLDLPRWDPVPLAGFAGLEDALGRPPVEQYDGGRDVLAVYAHEDDVRGLAPDFAKILQLGRRGFIATAPGLTHDCVSRFFCPSFGIGFDEDPVTGSAHCAIAPLWASKLGKKRLHAYQASPQGGSLWCELMPNAVRIEADASIRMIRQLDFSL